MNKIDNTIIINRLLDIYGRLLTSQQYEIMNDYYCLDLSLSEISENRNISRTAVSDALKTSVKKLEEYEKNLGICRVLDANKNENNKEIIEKLEKDIKNGI